MRLNSYIFSYLLDGEIRVFFAIIFALIIYAGQIYSSWKKTQNKKKKLFFSLTISTAAVSQLYKLLSRTFLTSF